MEKIKIIAEKEIADEFKVKAMENSEVLSILREEECRDHSLGCDYGSIMQIIAIVDGGLGIVNLVIEICEKLRRQKKNSDFKIATSKNTVVINIYNDDKEQITKKIFKLFNK